jgi:hypothetical protein
LKGNFFFAIMYSCAKKPSYFSEQYGKRLQYGVDYVRAMTGGDIVTEIKQVKREGRDRFKFKGVIVLRLAFAAGSWVTSEVQVKVGTLPLLAALGVGIAVAVGAVIAFLQMTAKGKEFNEPSTSSVEENEPYDNHFIQEWNDEDTTPNLEYEHNSLTDYTIPVTQLITYPSPAEDADENEPRLCGIEGEHAGSSYRVLDRVLSFGRDHSQCVILFPYGAGEISRLHCTLRYMVESRLFSLEDHGSSNGTFLANGDRLQPGKRYELRTGERFSLSGNEHVFEVRDGNLQ